MLLAGSVITRSILPTDLYWGNREYSNKVTNYRTYKIYNTVFFGSSRILTGINPLVFDSLINQHYCDSLKSFNLATPGTWANETFYLYENFLNDTSLSENVNHVFMEFQNIMAIRPDKLTTDKAIYYQSVNNIDFVIRYSVNEAALRLKSFPSSLYIITSHMLAGFQCLLNFNRLNINETPFDSLALFGTNSRGYLGLTEKASSRRNISANQLDAYKRSIESNLFRTKEAYNKVFYEKCMNLIHKSKQKGIKLVFVLPPVKLTPNMATVFNALPQVNKIEVCDPKKLPELYLEINWVDETHLSADGSTYLIQSIIREFAKISENK